MISTEGAADSLSKSSQPKREKNLKHVKSKRKNQRTTLSGGSASAPGSRGGVSSRGFRATPKEPKKASSTDTKAAASTVVSEPPTADADFSESDSNSDTSTPEDKAGKSNSNPKETGRTHAKAKKQATVKTRHLLFIGNLPKDATKEEVVSHFEKRGVHMREFRPLSHRDTGNSKGCGFMELGSYGAMQSALKLHRSRLKRKYINVEVTCGGGGKTEGRRAKIAEKNRILRKKRAMANPIKHKS